MTVAWIRTEGRLRPGNCCEGKKFVPTEAHYYREPPVGRRDFRNSQRTIPSQDETGRRAPRWAPGSGSLLGWGHEKAGVVVGGREKNKQARTMERRRDGCWEGVAGGSRLESLNRWQRLVRGEKRREKKRDRARRNSTEAEDGTRIERRGGRTDEALGRRRRKMGSWNVSGEAAGAGWRIEGTADAAGRGEKEKMARWKAKVRRTGSWRWRTAAGRFRGLVPLPPCVPPGPWANSKW